MTGKLKLDHPIQGRGSTSVIENWGKIIGCFSIILQCTHSHSKEKRAAFQTV